MSSRSFAPSLLSSFLVVAAGGSTHAAPPPGSLLASGQAAVWAFESGDTIIANTPFATTGGAPINVVCVGPSGKVLAGMSDGRVMDVTAGGNHAGAAAFATVPGNVMALACDGSHIYALADQQTVYDVTAGGSVTVPFAYNFGGFGFAFSVFMGPGGKLFVPNGSGVLDASAGGDVSMASYFATGSPLDFLVAGSTLGDEVYGAGYYGNIYDLSAGGATGAPMLSGLGHAVRVLASPAAVLAIDPTTDTVFDVGGADPVVFAVGAGANVRDLAYVPLCGDGYVHLDEACDGDGAGASGQTAGCDADCSLAVCGDGVANALAGEGCDGDGAGNGGETALCDEDCSAASCGDGLVNVAAGEACDGAETAECDEDCTSAACGDGHLNALAGEACDDGNGASGDGCDATCAVEGQGGAGGEDGTGGSEMGGSGGAGEAGTENEGGAADLEDVCVPGQQVACACPGGVQGAQACSDDGARFEECACPDAMPTSLDVDEGGCSATGGRGVGSRWWLALVALVAARVSTRRRSAIL